MNRSDPRPLSLAIQILIVLIGAFWSGRVAGEPTGNTVGLTFSAPGASEGYTLFSPHASQDAYLLDIQGRIVHRWVTDSYPGNTAYILPDGHLLRAGKTIGGGFPAGGQGGVVEEYDWDGRLLWSFHYSRSAHRQHHDAIKLPNGNVLMVAWEFKSAEEAIAAGRDPRLLTQGALWPDTLIEVELVGTGGAKIVWEWRAWDYLIQDFDPSRDTFGDVAGNPQLIDLNFARDGTADWMHLNGIDYHPELDQVVVGSPFLNEIWIIDHSTTTAEAAGHTGGRSGRGGDLLYRHGNPQAYRAGSGEDQSLFGQHHASWIPPGRPGAGNLLVFNNGRDRPGGAYSTVDELITPLGIDGSYGLAPGSSAEPAELAWTYPGTPDTSFYAEIVSGAQRLPNGNTLICQGPAGVIFEVAPDGTKVWEYITPVTITGILKQGDPPMPTNLIFRAYRYEPDYPGLSGRDLTPQGTIELDRAAAFRVIEVTRTESGRLLRWNSQTDRNYEVQFSADQSSGSWNGIGTLRAIGSSTTYLDSDPDRLKSPRGFYRILKR
jgi:hypothetical protein